MGVPVKVGVRVSVGVMVRGGVRVIVGVMAGVLVIVAVAMEGAHQYLSINVLEPPEPSMS